MRAPTKITEHKQGTVVVLCVSGRLDASNSGVFEEKLLGLIAGGEHRFVIDFAALDYISSAGLRVLVIAAKRLAASRGAIVLSGLEGQIEEVFAVVGFDSIFKTYRTADEAVAAFIQDPAAN